MFGVILAIALIVWVCVIWHKASQCECGLCGKKMNLSDRGVTNSCHKIYGNLGELRQSRRT